MTIESDGAIVEARPVDGAERDGPPLLRRIVIPVENPRTAPLFVTIARAMVEPGEGRLLVLTVVTDAAQAESSADTVVAVRDALDASFGPEHGIEVERRDASAVSRGILDFVREHNPDLVIMGMDVSANGQHFSAVADAVIDAVACPVLAIRPSEEIGIERVLVGVDGSDDARRLFADAHRGMEPSEVGAELAPWLVPPVIDDATAREMLAGSIAALTDIPGVDDQLALAVRASVAGGMAGIECDISAQATRLGDLLDRITAPVAVHIGTGDTVTPPAMAAWLGRRLDTEPTVHDGIGHELAIRRWADLLAEVAS